MREQWKRKNLRDVPEMVKEAVEYEIEEQQNVEAVENATCDELAFMRENQQEEPELDDSVGQDVRKIKIISNKFRRNAMKLLTIRWIRNTKNINSSSASFATFHPIWSTLGDISNGKLYECIMYHCINIFQHSRNSHQRRNNWIGGALHNGNVHCFKRRKT